MTNEKHPDVEQMLLSKAPVVEAILEVRCTATEPWEQDLLTMALERALPDYPSSEDVGLYRSEFDFDAQHGLKQHSEDGGWIGARRTSTDGKHVASIERFRFAFSRFDPYVGWEKFRGEGMRIWKIYCSLARPNSVDRLGLRFINRLPLTSGGDPLAYLDDPPRPIKGLDLDRSVFHHRDLFIDPKADIGIQVTRALVPSEQSGDEAPARSLIIDVDVFTNSPLVLDTADFEGKLESMRILKNKAFFGSISEAAMSDLT